MALGWFILGTAAGAIGTLALVRTGTVDPYAPNPAQWSDFIRGEYWIDETGGSEFADIDIGDKGHEAIALDVMIDKDVLIDKLIEYYEEQEDDERYAVEDDIAELEAMRDDEVDASTVYYHVSHWVPDEIGIAAVGGDKQLWEDIDQDPRLAYAKHFGAIQVVDTNFTTWKITKETLDNIIEFLVEMLGGEDELASHATERVWIEEVSTNRSAGPTVSELLNMKSARDLWALRATG